jgi:hypothetical protein
MLEPLAETLGVDGGDHATGSVAKLDTTAINTVKTTVEQIEESLRVQFGPLT